MDTGSFEVLVFDSGLGDAEDDEPKFDVPLEDGLVEPEPVSEDPMLEESDDEESEEGETKLGEFTPDESAPVRPVDDELVEGVPAFEEPAADDPVDSDSVSASLSSCLDVEDAGTVVPCGSVYCFLEWAGQDLCLPSCRQASSASSTDLLMPVTSFS